MSERTISIDGHEIGGENPCYVIAEIGANHNQDWETARQLVTEAVKAGADAVKFQSFTVENWLSEDFTEFPTVDAEDMREELRDAELPYELFEQIADYCEEAGIACFSTPSHQDDVDRLAEIGVPAFKFGSVQLTDVPTMRHAASYGEPIVFSGGAADMSEVLQTVEAIEPQTDVALLHCTSLYPTDDYGTVNLDVLDSYRTMFDFPVGYSDHTMDPVTVPVAAVTKGADILEKHVTLDRSMDGPDHPFALEPDEFDRMVTAVRRAEEALGDSYRRLLSEEEEEIARQGRRSLVATTDIEAGDTIEEDDLTFKRPGTGISPRQLELIVGRTARRDVPRNRVVTWDHV